MPDNAYEPINNKKFISSTGVGHLWARIRERYDGKLDNVTAANNSIAVTDLKNIAVNISGEEDNQLMVKPGDDGGLYVGKPVLHKLTFGSDQNYVYDGTEDVTVPVYTGEYEP